MPFDFGFDFRGSAGFVTDPSYAAPVLGEAYPNTYTNADGKSINAGWQTAANTVDRNAASDVRLAGINYNSPPGITFQVDLGSGSNPGRGTYTVDFAIGDHGFSHPTNPAILRDGSTVLSSFDASNVLSSWVDATGVLHGLPIPDWDAVKNTASYVFATTTCTLELQVASDNACMVHLRLTQTAVASTGGAKRRLLTLGVGA